MTRRPTCPECRSDQIVPDVTNGGAGRNRCAACNHVGAVRDFYPDSRETLLAGGRIGYLASVTRSWPEIVARHVNATETPKPRHKPAPIRQYKDD